MINFVKMHGLGNDFVIINAWHKSFNLSPERIRELANRHTGIGFDQLLVLEPPPNQTVDAVYRIFNADGSEVAQCGNGARCAARFLVEQQLVPKTTLQLLTQAGILEAQLENDKTVTIKMGIPEWLPAQIPFIADQAAADYLLKVNQKDYRIQVLALGNPHCVLTVADVATAPVTTLGADIAKHPRFPESVNVGFMEIINHQQIKLRVFERGAGETQACGSGACAAVIAGRTAGLLDASVAVKLPGGQLTVSWDGQQQPVYLRGPAETVFTGTISE